MSIEQLEREVFETEAKALGLQESIAESRVSDLTGLVTATGKLKGHLKGITPKQFRDIIGKEPLQSTIRVSKDETQAKIPYELALDQIMSERGFDDVEDIKEAIEKAHRDKAELESLWRDRDIIINDITDALKRGKLKSETIVVQRELPIFTETKGPAKITKVDGSSTTSRRQHSFWRVDVDLDGDGKVDKSFRVRYAVDAKRIVGKAIKQAKVRISRETQSRLEFAPRPKKLQVGFARGKQPRELTQIATEDYQKRIRKERKDLLKRGREERQALLAQGRKERRLRQKSKKLPSLKR